MGGVNNPFALTPDDYEALERRYIGPEQIRLNDIYRVDDVEGARVVGRKFGGDGKKYSGLVIRNYRVESLNHRSERLRRDYPDLKPRTDGKPGFKEEAKYLWSPGSRSQFYFPHGNTREQMRDVNIPRFFIEGEFKAVSLKRVLTEGEIDALVIGLYGCNNWSGTTGKTENASGEREDEKGPVNDFEDIEWQGSEVVICRDSNFRTNDTVNYGMRGLASFLTLMGATVYYADTPDLEGVNGLDDLAGMHGPDAVLEVLDNRHLAIKPKEPKEKLSPEERKARADELRKRAGQSTDALAADVLGSTAARHLLKLWAEAGLSDEAVRLLITLEALAVGCDELDFLYAELYPLLYKLKGDEFETTATGGRSLRSSYRKKIRDRFDRLDAEQQEIGITFAYLIPGKLDNDDNLIPSHVSLYSRRYVAEAMILAETTPGYSRAMKATRMEAIGKIVEKISGKAYLKRNPPRKDINRKIAEGLRRIEGHLAATLQRMRSRGDSERDMWMSIMLILPAGLVAFIKSQGVTEYLGGHESTLKKELIQGTFPPSEPFHQPHSEGDFRVPSESALSYAESTDARAGFSKTCTNLQPNLQPEREHSPEAKAIWDRCRAAFNSPAPSPKPVNESPPEITAEMIAEAYEVQAETMREAAASLEAEAVSSDYDASLRIGPAIWHAPEGDLSVMIKEAARAGPDGRRYVWADGVDTPIPLDQVEYRELSPEEFNEQMEEVLASISVQ